MLKCLGWQLLLSQEEAAVPRRKMMMMMRTAGQSNLEAPSLGAMAGEYPGVGGGPGCALGTFLYKEGHHSSCLYPHHPGALLYPPAASPVNMEGRHHGIPVEVESIQLPPATLECFAFD